MKRLRDNFLTCFVSLFLLLAGGTGYIAFSPLIRTWSYEPVNGVIIQSDMESCGVEVGGYSEQIRFTYTVDGQRFQDGRLRRDFARMCEPKKTIAAILERYPVGANVQGWYDPDRPQIGVIERSPGTMHWVMIAVNCGFLFIFLCIWGIQRSNAHRYAEIEQRRNDKAAADNKKE